MQLDWLSLAVANDEKASSRMEETAGILLSGKTEAHFGHGYEGVKVAGGTGNLLCRKRRNGNGDVLLMLSGQSLDWIRDTHVLGDLLTETTDQDICAHFRKKGCGARASMPRWIRRILS